MADDSRDTPPPDGGAEFEAYAPDYAAGMDDPVKRMLGGSFDAFMDLKAACLLRDLARHPPASRPNHALRLLDFGCGTGEMLQGLRQQGFRGELTGCDVSKGMLTEAARRWHCGPLPPLYHTEEGRLPFPDQAFDLVIICCVLHHVTPAKHADVLAELYRILRPGGRLVIFEHNPLNPVTRWIVARAPIDRNAILVRAGKVRRLLGRIGWEPVRTSYLLFFPPRLGRLRALEAALAWCPLGGQYMVVAEKPLPPGRVVFSGP